MLPCEVVRGQEGRWWVRPRLVVADRQAVWQLHSKLWDTLAEDIESLKMFSYYYFKIHYAMEEFLGKDMNYLVG